MQPPKQHSWINLVEMKGELTKKLGLERSKQYLDYLNRFLSLKLSKAEFNKLCLKTIGKDNIRLHNHLIRAVVENACTGNVSTGIHDDTSRTVKNKKPLEGVYHQNGLVPVVTQVTNPLTLTNGEILPASPRKARTGTRERRIGDRKSVVGPFGNTNSTPLLSSIPQSGDFSVELENGVSSPDTQSAVHHQQFTTPGENVDFVAVNHVEQTESLGRKDGNGVSDRNSLHAPLGVPFCPVRIGGACRALPSASSKSIDVLHTDCLLETRTLKEHMEQIVATHGFQRVSMDCANLLNSALDVYMKGLIRSCTEINGPKSIYKPTKSGFVKHPTHMRSINGVGPGHHYHHQIQSSSWPLGVMQEHEAKTKQLVTLLDFRVAMELNCKQLGEDWPVLLEKICAHDFEE